MTHKRYKSLVFPGPKKLSITNLKCLQVSTGKLNLISQNVRYILHVSRRKSQTLAQYKLDGHRMECLPHVRDLRAIVSSDLPWSKHIDVIVARDNETLGFVKRLIKDTNDLN